MFMLNVTFLTNGWVASLRSPVGCQVMAAAMHYSMLATFTWFAMEAFHLCQQLYKSGSVPIPRYIMKVCIAGWGEWSDNQVAIATGGFEGDKVR